jgi:hypothetical protein
MAVHATGPGMLADVAWLVLHGASHQEEAGLVSFEAALGGVVALLVVVGTLWYLGVFASLGGDDAGGERPADAAESEAGD